MTDNEETFMTAGGAPGCSDTATPLDDCLIVDGYVLGDEATGPAVYDGTLKAVYDGTLKEALAAA